MTMNRTLLLLSLAGILGYGCDNADMAPTTPEPEATYAATPESVGGGSDGLTTMGAVSLRAPIREGSVRLYQYPTSEADRQRGKNRYDINLQWPEPPGLRNNDFYFYMVEANGVGVRGGKVYPPILLIAVGHDEAQRKSWITANGIYLPPNAQVCGTVKHRRRAGVRRKMDLGCRRTGSAPAPYVEPEPEPEPEPDCSSNERTGAEWEAQITCVIAWKRNACSNFVILAGRGEAQKACCQAAGARWNTFNYGKNTACLLPGHLHYGDSH